MSILALLTPEELAEKLAVPASWIREKTRARGQLRDKDPSRSSQPAARNPREDRSLPALKTFSTLIVNPSVATECRGFKSRLPPQAPVVHPSDKPKKAKQGVSLAAVKPLNIVSSNGGIGGEQCHILKTRLRDQHAIK